MKHNPYKVLIISCWIMLILCFVIQLFGADWFNVSTQNETFIKVCNFIEDRLWLKQLCACLICLILGTFSLLAMLGQKWYNKIQFCIFIPLIIFMSYIGWYSQLLNSILGFLIYFMPCVWLKKKWYNCLIGNVLIVIFQLLSIFIKNVGGIYLNNSVFLISTILQIDSLIMVVLYYLYSTRKERKNG